jgi:hypothetical protein
MTTANEIINELDSQTRDGYAVAEHINEFPIAAFYAAMARKDEVAAVEMISGGIDIRHVAELFVAYDAMKRGGESKFTVEQVEQNFRRQVVRHTGRLDADVFMEVVNEAMEATAESPRWRKAVEIAAQEILSGNVPEFIPNGSVVVRGRRRRGSDQYEVGRFCTCPSADFDSPCWHRAAVRLMRRYNERLGI